MPAAQDRIELRRLAARDSLDAITELLHRAYAPLAERGLNFTAATQDVATTQRRIAEGQCFVAEQAGRIVGTVTACGPYDLNTARWAAPVKAFRDRDTAHFHQFAVEPGMQRRGIGRRLVAACEQWARERGYKRLALDTAEGATELRALYRHLGYVDTDRVQWAGKTYGSVIMDKALDHSPLRAQLRLLARYNLWATQALCRQVDALSEADYRRDAGLFFKSVHGTLNHLLVTGQGLWLRRFAEGVSPALALDAELEPDRHALRERLVDGALSWLPLIEVWPESRLMGQISYTRTDGRAQTLPFADTLMHVFNHGTHHRGQISAALTMMGHPAPVLDLVVMLVQDAEAAA